MRGPRDDDPGVTVDVPVLRDAAGGEAATASERAAESGAFEGASGAQFAVQDLVGRRYRVQRFIASGGMGEVYEARDVELREVVALKTIRPDIAGNTAVLSRFRREIQLARRVTHPNVCRIFDFDRHEDVTPFLTMELLRGETLGARLVRGPFSAEEALPIVRQMAAGLEAAHQAGVIHRDFKPGNVFLSDMGPGNAVRVVITDFGVARTLGGDEADAGMTRTGDTIGSPAYMSPEQVEGKAVTPSTDVYALGVVMYEMVTGHRPFEGDSGLSATVRRVQEDAPSPRLHVPDLPTRWEEVILGCLERKPSRRYASATEVMRALGDGQGWRWRRVFAGALMALAIVLVGNALYPVWRGFSGAKPATSISAPAPTKPPVTVRRAIAVLGLKNLSGRQDLGWLQTAIAELLATELAAGEKLRLIPGENIARMQMEGSLPRSNSYNSETLAKVRTALGADLVVTGSYLATGKKRLRIDLRLQDTKDGSTVTTVGETGHEEELVELVTQGGSRLRAKLGLGELSEAEVSGLRQALPESTEAAKLYAEGLGRLRRFDALGAQKLLERGLTLEPKHAPLHTAMAATWTALGYDARAKAEAKQAFDLSTTLGREERLWVEALYREAAQEWDTAIGVYRSLFTFFPDNLEYGLRLASCTTSAGKGKEALQALAALRTLGDDPRIDLAEAQAHKNLGDSKLQAEAARRAAEKGRARGARLVEARAYLEEGWAYQQLAEYDKSVAANERARVIFAQAGDLLGQADAIRGSASVLYDSSAPRPDPARAASLLIEALALYKRIGNQVGIAACESGLGAAAGLMGQRRQSLRHYEAALSILRSIGNKRGLAFTLGNYVDAATELGELSLARKTSEEALRLAGEMENNFLLAFLSENHEVLLERLGELKEADGFGRRSIELFRKFGDGQDLALSLRYDAVVRRDQGDLTLARRELEEARRLEKASGYILSFLYLELGPLDLDEGHLNEALENARTAAANARKTQRPDALCLALALEARTLLASGQSAKASEVLQRAAEASRETDSFDAAFELGLARALVDAAQGKAKPALAALGELVGRAERARYVRPAFEARLAIGQIELASGAAATGRKHLSALEHDAKAKGFLLIARQAAAALQTGK